MSENEKEKVEEYLKKGVEFRLKNDFSAALREYRKAVEIAPENRTAQLRLASIYIDLANYELSHYYLSLAQEALQKVLKIEPLNEEAHQSLITLHFKKGTLGELAREYKEKLKSQPEQKLWAKYLNQIILIGKESLPPSSGEKGRPGFIIRFTFDYFLLPSGILTIITSLMSDRFRPFLFLGLVMLGFFLIYKIATFLIFYPNWFKKM